MKKYKEWGPTPFDTRGLNADDLDRGEWLVAPVSMNRDSRPFAESNFHSALKMLGGEGEAVEVHRFGHWACGWFEIILVAPGTRQEEILLSIEEKLENYPVLDDDDLSERERECADKVWKNCYTAKDRIEYIRKNRSQFEFRDFADMLGCVRGNYFCGYASELCE